MEKEYFIGIVPPQEYLKRIERFQRKWLDSLIVEPHITLKAQGGLTSDKEWIEQVEKVCLTIKPFHITLSNPTYFGDNILYLSVDSNHLQNVHQKIVKEISPSAELIKKYFELDDFVGHLTLAKEQYGLSKQDLKDMEELASKELTPYPTFEVTFIRIYELNIENQRYEKYLDIPWKN